MSLRQILVLVFALVAGLGALVLVRGAASNAPAATAQPASAVTPLGPMVLVAAEKIEAGELADPGSLRWVMWPKEAVGDGFVLQTGPEDKSLQDFVGAVARIDILKGEPITTARLIKKGDTGFFAAMLEPGFRAVSLPISVETAATGFIMPNDRVDVILTRKVEIQRNSARFEEIRSDVVLENVRVLTIDATLRDPSEPGTSPRPLNGGVATLALSARDAETLAMADEMGDISLALRGLEGEPRTLTVASAKRPGARALEQNVEEKIDNIRIHSYGSTTESRVVGSGQKGLFE